MNCNSRSRRFRLFLWKKSTGRDFLPVSPKNVEDLFQKLKELASTIKKGALQRLTKHILSDMHLMERFKTAPAAKSMHHAYLGGLLEHTVAVTELASFITTFYPDLNRDLLMVGAILHDIGKVDEFVYDLCIDYSSSGRLLGHMVLGVQILDEKIRVTSELPSGRCYPAEPSDPQSPWGGGDGGREVAHDTGSLRSALRR